MINLRYHIVSITAVFLALGIGLTLGSTFLDRVTVDTLKAQLDDVQAQVDRTNEENATLGREVDELSSRDAALAEVLPERLLDGRLDGVPVLAIATRGTAAASMERALGALDAAGADLAGTWWLTDRWELDDEEEVDDLRELLDLATSDVERLRRNGAIRLAELIHDASAPAPATDSADTGEETPGTVPEGEPGADSPPTSPTTIASATTVPDDVEEPRTPSEPELVADLVEAGFLEYEARPGTDEPRVLLPPFAVRYVVISELPEGGGAQDFATALVDEVAAEGPVPVLAAQGRVELDDGDEPAPEEVERSTFIGPIREGELTSERVSTLDSLDTASGIVALVLAVEDLATPTIGHYGVAPGASRLLPGPVAEP